MVVLSIAGPSVRDEMALRDSLRLMPRWEQVRWLARRGLADPYLRDCTPVQDSGLRCIGRWSFGPSTWVDVRATADDTIVFLSRGSGVSIVRFRSQDSLRLDLLSDINSHGLTGRCQVRDTLLYVNSGGVECYDISNLTSPVLLNWLSQPLIYDFFVVDTFLYTSSRDSLRIFSVSNPASPRWLGACADSGYVIYVSGNHAYLGHQAGLFILDVSNPASPHRVATMGFDVLSIWVQDTLLYFGTYDSTFRVYNVKNPAAPAPVGSLGGIAPACLYQPLTCDTVIYTSSFDVIGVANPATPRRVGSVSPPGWEYGVAVVPALIYALVADFFDGLAAINIANPTVPSIDTFLFNAGLSEDICLDQNKAYVAQLEGGLRILDVSSPELPRLLGGIDIPGVQPSTYAAVARDSFAFAGWTPVPQFRAIDVSNPARPALAGGCDVTNYPEDIVLRDTLAYLAEDYVFEVVNVARPRQPELVGSCGLPGDSRALAVKDAVAYVAQGSRGLYCVGIADPRTPAVQGSWAGRSSGVCVVDTLAFVAGPYTGCVSLNVANPASLRVLDSLHLTDTLWWNDVVVVDSLAYVGGERIWVVDVSDPWNMRLVSGVSWKPPYLVRRLFYAPPYLYAACYEAGVCILETVQVGMNEPSAARRPTSQPTMLTPNPSPGLVSVRAGPDLKSVVVRDVLGRAVKLVKPGGVVFTIDLAGCQSGLYFIELRYDTGRRTEKLIKQ